ncbi:MAG TPA: hypothetical protein ENI96_12265 [Sedimenticola thiotaurini]|uniref:Dicarboxylate transport domain-containing protein n=1 Tax=Sedimenticola thiotaurini TaxID=1543721 RepID=A0A831RPP7_9GAMM|nr:hypothetical protein [Sedimenticola thiotaurini]
MSFLPNRGLRPALVGLSLLGTLATAWAVQLLQLQIGALQGEDWALQGVSLSVDLGDRAGARQAFELQARRFRHRLLPGPVEGIRVVCGDGTLSDRGIGCGSGRLSLQSAPVSARSAPLRFDWRQDRSSLELELKDVVVAGGRLALELADRGGRWQGSATATGLELSRLPALFGVAPQPGLGGTMALSLRAAGDGDRLERGRWGLTLNALAFSNPDGTYLGDGVALQWDGGASGSGAAIAGQQRLQLLQGALLTPFAYLSPERGAITLASDWRLTGRRLTLSALDYRDPGLLRLQGELRLSLTGAGASLDGGHLSSGWSDVGRLFSSYLQPALGDPAYDQLQLDGRVRLEATLDEPSGFRLQLDGVDVEQPGQLQLRGLSGDLRWRADAPGGGNRLAWKGGRLLRIPFGGAAMELRIGPDRVALERPLVLPLWDGELHVDRLSLAGIGSDGGLEGSFQGFLTPVSIERVTRSFGWPELAGRLSGMIPMISYRDGTLSVDGTLLIRIFDGRILIRNLRLEDLFGPLPVLSADIRIHGLDLETLTRTFSFGKITGRLDGEISGLRLEGWRPVAFDARFQTPADDDTPHRISQRAVDNIANLGGAGLSGALSRSFLRVFEEFGYSRLGIRCRLHDGICDMGGVAPAKQGYYLVQGGGIPRIDIVGFNRRTDWELLVQKLREITETDVAPVIE